MLLIKTIVFDVGQVLLTFEVEEYVRDLFGAKEEREKFSQRIFRGEEWLLADRGKLNEKELLTKLIERYPYWKESIVEKVGSWEEIVKPIEESVEIVRELKKCEDRKLFILSNFPREAFTRAKEKYDFFALFDGIVVSYEEGLIKPERGMYLALLERYSLLAHETLFIDDRLVNIQGGREMGIEGILYEGPDRLRSALRERGLL